MTGQKKSDEWFQSGLVSLGLILSADRLNIIDWFVNTAFTVHPQFKSHTGGPMTLGHGCILNGSPKQAEGKLVGADGMSQLIFWTKLFMKAQGYQIKHNVRHQDNKSTILLLENGMNSSTKRSTKRTHALNIHHFYLTYQIKKGNVEVEHCHKDKMVADCYSKPHSKPHSKPL